VPAAAQRVATPAITPMMPARAMVASAMLPVRMLIAQPKPKLAMARPLASIRLTSGSGRPLRRAYQGCSARQATSSTDRPSQAQAHMAPREIHTVVPQISSSVAEYVASDSAVVGMVSNMRSRTRSGALARAPSMRRYRKPELLSVGIGVFGGASLSH
jgi:hypothetical protein